MPLPRILGVVSLLACTLFVACGGSVSVLHARGKPTGSGTAAVKVLNSSGTAIDKLYVAKTEDVDKARAAGASPGSAEDDALWGDDELGRAGLDEGKTFDDLKLPEGRYDVLVVDKGGREQLIKSLRLQPGGRYVLEIGTDWTMGRL